MENNEQKHTRNKYAKHIEKTRQIIPQTITELLNTDAKNDAPDPPEYANNWPNWGYGGA